MNWFIKGLKQYADFNGRARRKEFWMFLLFNVLIIIALSFISEMLSNIFYLATLVPYLAVGVRRVHDLGKSGWYILIPIYNIILFCTDGDSGPNEYGDNPKGIGNDKSIDQIGVE